MKCIIGHEIKTDTGFKVFEAGREYPESDTVGREKYFEIINPPEVEEIKPRPAYKKREVMGDDSAG